MRGARTAARLATAGDYVALASPPAGATEEAGDRGSFPGVCICYGGKAKEGFGGRNEAVWKDLFLTAIVMQSGETLKVYPLGKIGLFISFNYMAC